PFQFLTYRHCLILLITRRSRFIFIFSNGFDYLCIPMKSIVNIPAVLLLEDGTVFYGKAAGKIGIATGEICFNTGMTGYQEIFTDPSYYAQIMVTTNAHIGNYGILPEE